MARKKPIKRKRKPETKLHPTLQSDVYYTYFHNLPIEAQKKLKEAETVIENSRYTVFEDSAFIRATVAVNGKLWDAEISLGSVDIKNADYDYDDEIHEYVDDHGRVVDRDKHAEYVAEEVRANMDLDYQDVYLTFIKELK